MRVFDIMSRKPITLFRQDTINRAAQVFHNNKIDGAPVVDNQGKLLGIFTKSHLMEVIIDNLDRGTLVEELMTWDLIKINEDEPIEKALETNVGRLPVVNSDNELVGILTRTDLVRGFYLQSQEVVGELTTILDSSHNGIIAVNQDGLIITFNAAAEKIMGRKSTEVLGKPLIDILPNTGLIGVLKDEREESGKKLNIGNVTVLTNRSLIYKNGELKGAMAIFQDVSDLEKISEELNIVKNLNKELDAIIESVSDGLYITNGKGDTIRINSSYEKITGIKSEDVLGRNMRELVAEGIFSESVTFQVLEKREPVTVMHELKSGQRILSTGNPVFNEEGKIVRVVTTARDVKELNHLKEELEKTKQLSKKYYSELEKLRLQQLELDDVVVKSDKMEKIIDLALQIGGVDSTVLITGESGVGKEIIARTIHKSSKRSKNSFMKVNCGAIPDNLLEAELFGYEKGAFTGAKSDGKPGIFELADKGTILLDEVGELPLNLQVKLLRVLQEEEIMRVGGTESIKIDVRVLAATNRDLDIMLQEGTFREDLYYRLNVVPIHIPPLRERKADIAPLSYNFLNQFNKKYNVNKKIALETIEYLEYYKWPGNVRELKNLIERFVVMYSQDIIEPRILPKKIKEIENKETDIKVTDIIPLKKAVSKVEKDILKMAFEKCSSTYEVARVLEVSQPTVVRKRKKYMI
ncbi:sigma-54-dependent Fis family transcriptional regulator [Halocella sp. SP3-1]|uniref:sigma-54-dependent Fis family transcriptional regulator n=1 Tax=Halocella sp. SP3-1 TaxID=2382161 RepID=UPI000F75C178|nr:sigma-54-dependent Fis family transcriptional regulator [Halocella sp. SP3-1]AZO96350.1 CBS domain-containing protein [Halocella sp. SP3-1]